MGLSRLAGALRVAGEEVRLIDGALEGYLYTLGPAEPGSRKARALANLTSPRGYASFDRYKKSLADLAGPALSDRSPAKITPADFRHRELSPLRSEDLARAFRKPEENPYYGWFAPRLEEALAGREEEIAAVSLCYLSQALTAAAILGWIKRQFPGTTTILGGSLISSWAKSGGKTWKKLAFLADHLVPGAGEEPLVALTGRPYRGPGTPWFGDLYQKPYLAPGRILPFSASLGCSWKRCTFCAERWEDYPYRPLPPEDARNRLDRLIHRHKPILIHLTDSEISPDFMDNLMKDPPGTAWYGFSRFLKEMISRDYCRALADSGCAMLCLGLESGDQEVLNRLKKGISLDWVSPILRNLKEAGIGTYVYLLFGTPAENRERAMNTVSFIEAHRAHIDFLNLAVFTLPGISGEARGLSTSSFYEGDLSLSMDFDHPAGWNRREIRRFLDRTFHRNRDLRPLIGRTPPVFTSSHAPFFL